MRHPKYLVLRRICTVRKSEFLVAWQRNSLYGTLASIDVGGRALVVKPSPSSTGDATVRVSLPSSVKLRTASPDARRITESTSFAIDDLKPGEPVYVRGTRSADGSGMEASVVLEGWIQGHPRNAR